jgi:type IV secretion system protein VirB1
MDALLLLFERCAPAIDTRLITHLVRQESAFNPYAIGLDGKAVLKPQPRTLASAIAKVEELITANQQFSVGLSQVHISNVRRYGLTWEQAFDSCTNLQYGQRILRDFHSEALKAGYKDGDAVFAALRGYNSGRIHSNVSNGYATTILNNVINGATVVRSPHLAATVNSVKGGRNDSPASRPARHVGESKDLFEIETSTESNLPGSNSRVVNKAKELFE